MSLRMDKKVLLKRMQNCVRVLVAKVWLSMGSTSWGEEIGSGEPTPPTMHTQLSEWENPRVGTLWVYAGEFLHH